MSRIDVYRAFRRLEMMMPSISPYRDISPPQLPEKFENALSYCENCRPKGNHECTNKALEITIIYDKSKSEVRAERREIPCQCNQCHPTVETEG